MIDAAEILGPATTARAKPTAANGHRPDRPMPVVFSARELMATKLPEPRWAVPGILPEGLTLLAGKPKAGKSFLALGLAVAVAAGGTALGQVQVEQGAVLYAALEDTKRRLQDRLAAHLGDDAVPDSLHFMLQVPRQGDGGLEWLLSWAQSHQDARLLVVDTLARFRPPVDGRGSAYDQDYAALVGLKRIADSCRVAVVVIHHTRKQAASDPLDEVSGTHGLAGAADAVQVLKRDRDRSAAAELYMTGRDIEERRLPLRWDPQITAWTLTAPQLTPERQAITDWLLQAGHQQPHAIAAAVLKERGTVRQLLRRMHIAGQVRQDGDGAYFVPSRVTPVTVVTGVTGDVMP
jgi:hypothetical protein